ncbi:acetyl-CoA carboxylase biotin carboxyl carrier protein [Bacillus benzoevorans]|uniref:Biotin carboxyl carrier protein of acetyl-CoA carboxylase n=1 Tax=Bacillus benzoevorans TaxID=1456 RepID=A0A7X0HSP0_9BACI|nr:acetyl-CoA carboxylase biotin carboxyl carrier protein [Bacillus benzoevorans]MBB6444876.1 acetyl-CoA carboxylase biotin carboxyl carrier protein [Bacillus benzoevorans]
MFKVQEIRELIKLIGQSNIDEFVYEADGAKLKMKKNSAGEVVAVPAALQAVQQPVQTAAVEAVQTPVQAVQAEAKAVAVETVSEPESAVDTANLQKITSPMVGTFYQSPGPDQDPYVRVGAKVSEASIVCIVEAMKLFNEIEAEVDGEIVEILVKDGQLVEYGQPLFLVKPE